MDSQKTLQFLKKVQNTSVIMLIIYTCIYYAALLLVDKQYTVLLSDIISPVGVACASVFMYISIKKIKNDKAQKIWKIFFAGIICFLLGDLYWLYNEIIMKSGMYPFISDVFYVLQSVFFIAALFLLMPKKNIFRLFRNGFDVLILLTIFMAVDTKFILIPLLSQNIEIGNKFLTILYPLFDITLFFMALTMYFYDTGDKRQFRSQYFVFSSLMLVAVDQYYSVSVLYNTFLTDKLINPIWVATLWGFSIVAIKAAQFHTTHSFPTKDDKELDLKEEYNSTRKTFVTYISVSIFIIMVFIFGIEMSILTIGIAIINILIIIRQVFILLENKHLIKQVVETNKQLHIINQKATLESKIDFLTELYNRRHVYLLLDELIKDAKEKKGGFSVLLIDIDYFKLVNDTYGHTAGDMVLKQVADLFKTHLRSFDIIGRWGGEEFLIILPLTDAKAAEFIAERIRTEVEKRVFCCDYENKLEITISVGISEWLESDEDFTYTISRADQSLYTAKETGRNRVAMWNAG